MSKKLKTLTIIEGNMKDIKLHKGAAMFMINGGKVDPKSCIIEIERVVINKYGSPMFGNNGKLKTEIIKDYIVGFKISVVKK